MLDYYFFCPYIRKNTLRFILTINLLTIILENRLTPIFETINKSFKQVEREEKQKLNIARGSAETIHKSKKKKEVRTWKKLETQRAIT